MTPARRVAALMLAIGLGAGTAGATPADLSSPCGRFRLSEPVQVRDGSLLVRSISVLGGAVVLNGVCPATRARLRLRRWGTRVAAFIPACGEARRIKVRARIDGDCTAMQGRLRVRRPRTRARFEAVAMREQSCGLRVTCGPGEFCESPPGLCANDAPGSMCLPRPDACLDVFLPVCGCDGVTYGNDCERQAVGVSQWHDGACDCIPIDCPPDTEPVDGDGDGCPDLCRPLDCRGNDECRADAYCATERGQCGGRGTCLPRPRLCPLAFMPVCGCDGQTYGNACEAAAAGVNVAHDGACEALCGTIAGIPCPEGMVCDLEPGLCEVVDVGGTCTPRPDGCPEIYAPVCGCDGVTYGNDCERLAAGAQKDRDGRCECPDLQCPPDTEPVDTDGDGCPDTCIAVRCAAAADCADDRYCAKPLGECDALGVCTPRPLGCPDVWEPVCGCDGQTHANWCDAAAAGTSIRHEGACEAMCGTLLGIPCPAGMHCELPAGTCAAADLGGTCIPIPEVCPRIFAPVCGCDGVTYANECERIAARAQQNHDGPCECPRLECPIGATPVDTDGDGCPDLCSVPPCDVVCAPDGCSTVCPDATPQ